MTLPKYDSDIPEGHAFAETRNLHGGDRYLRCHGFKIQSRPNGKLAIWLLGDTPYTEAEAREFIEQTLAKVKEKGK